jgi:hypothetical protein
MAAVLLVLVVILGGTVSSYMGIIDIFFYSIILDQVGNRQRNHQF